MRSRRLSTSKEFKRTPGLLELVCGHSDNLVDQPARFPIHNGESAKLAEFSFTNCHERLVRWHPALWSCKEMSTSRTSAKSLHTLAPRLGMVTGLGCPIPDRVKQSRAVCLSSCAGKGRSLMTTCKAKSSAEAADVAPRMCCRAGSPCLQSRIQIWLLVSPVTTDHYKWRRWGTGLNSFDGGKAADDDIPAGRKGAQAG